MNTYFLKPNNMAFRSIVVLQLLFSQVKKKYQINIQNTKMLHATKTYNTVMKGKQHICRPQKSFIKLSSTVNHTGYTVVIRLKWKGP